MITQALACPAPDGVSSKSPTSRCCRIQRRDRTPQREPFPPQRRCSRGRFRRTCSSYGQHLRVSGRLHESTPCKSGRAGGGRGAGPGRQVAFASCTPGANSGAQRSRDPVISEPQQRGERSSGTVSVVESVLISPPPERLLPAVPSRGGPQPCQRLQSKISPMCVALRDFRGIMAGTRASPSTCPGLSCKQMSCTRILRRARCWRRARRGWAASVLSIGSCKLAASTNDGLYERPFLPG